MGKPKKVVFQLIDPNERPEPEAYILLRELRAEQHFDAAEARIALAWQKAIKPDVDGRLMLGKCVKATDLQRELVELDFVILLNREVWDDIDFRTEKKIALLDHEMCHAARAVDSDGEPRIDTKGRPVWRIRGHDIEEFREVVARHGCYKHDLEKFAQALIERKAEPLFTAEPAAQGELLMQPGVAVVEAMAEFVRPIAEGNLDSVTISTPGREPVVIDKETAARVRNRAKAARRPKDPG